ncbi:MAG: hypothetical protein IAE80_07670 [Anaerolinea sp.]|nr:hypothetical protein [Anaerolinea sp.]
MKYALIQAERGSLPLQRACRVLHVSVSGYYAWQQRRQPAKAKDVDERLVAHIRRCLLTAGGRMAARG